jgi:hypothetical protein
MANFEGTTASSGAKLVKGTDENGLLNIISEYGTGECNVTVENGEIAIWGYDYFQACLLPPDDPDVEWDDQDRTDELLERIAPYLAEPLIIHCVGAEKCRFPLSAVEIKVNPSGLVEWNTFKFEQ